MTGVEARERILAAAAELLAESNGEPVSTRAICNRADVGPPTLYHHFGDKDGLFDAVVAQRFAEFLAAARAVPASGDPVEDLRRGWQFHVDFGRANPAFYVLMYAQPAREGRPKAAADARADLVALLQDVAGAGRLRGEVELAADTVEAAVVGATLHAINNPDAPRTALRDAVFAAVLTDASRSDAEAPTLARIATQFGALVARADNPLTQGERTLLAEWVARITE
ncbi:MAG TPA: TetR/AcrR family transcriptional regulator [Pseudonocardiaceae bacterium]